MSEGVEVGEQLRARRQALGLNQEQLAVRAGISKATLAKIENGGTERAYRRRDVERALDEIEALFAKPVLTDDDLLQEFERWFPGLMNRRRQMRQETPTEDLLAEIEVGPAGRSPTAPPGSSWPASAPPRCRSRTRRSRPPGPARRRRARP